LESSTVITLIQSFQKSYILSTITLGVRISTYEFWGSTNIQSHSWWVFFWCPVFFLPASIYLRREIKTILSWLSLFRLIKNGAYHRLDCKKCNLCNSLVHRLSWSRNSGSKDISWGLLRSLKRLILGMVCSTFIFTYLSMVMWLW
jgi:hypothetical protein